MGTQPVIESDTYCRDIEAYLFRKNEGHLIRIVGPAFDLVSGWSKSGIPFKVVCAGIDRYFERYYRRERRRRPVRVEFCEADVLDAFDDWRRSVGVNRATNDQDDVETSSRRGPSLAAHVEKVLTRLTLLRGSAPGAELPSEIIERAVRTLDALQPRARTSRGQARELLIAQLEDIERQLLAAAAETLAADERARLEAEAEQELAPFRARMPAEAFVRASGAALTRLIRERFTLPRIAYE